MSLRDDAKKRWNKGTMSLRDDAKKRWNKEATEYNQWGALGEDEKQELIEREADILACELCETKNCRVPRPCPLLYVYEEAHE